MNSVEVSNKVNEIIYRPLCAYEPSVDSKGQTDVILLHSILAVLSPEQQEAVFKFAALKVKRTIEHITNRSFSSTETLIIEEKHNQIELDLLKS